MKTTDVDLVIIGGGPAGLTAGIYAARARINVVLVEMVTPGGQILVTDWIENYPGFPEGLTGAELVQRMVDQAQRFDLKIESGEVASLEVSGPKKIINLTDNSRISAQAIILAAGASPKKLDIPGEAEFHGRGVSFCGTCDGPFFRDRVVAAVGGGDTAVQESLFLTKFVKKVYLIHRRDELRATKILQERAFKNDKIEFVWDSVATQINGASGVESITVKNVKTRDTKDLAVNGCFVWVGTTPNAGFIGKDIKTDEFGFIVTDHHMATSVPGVFAAGDIRNTPLRQVATAVGDAAIAAISAEHYLDNIKR